MDLYASPTHRDHVYETMVKLVDCGPFDGGCLMFARALQHIHGGEVQVVEGRLRHPRTLAPGKVMAQHAVLCLPSGQYIDGDGEADDAQAIAQRFAKQECMGLLDVTCVRPWVQGDLPEAPWGDEHFEILVQALLNPPPASRHLLTHSR